MSANNDSKLEYLTMVSNMDTQHIWDVLITQSYIFGSINLSLLILSFGLLFWIFRWLRKNGEIEWVREISHISYFVIGFLTFILILVSMESLEGIIGAIINPEYRAFQLLTTL